MGKVTRGGAYHGDQRSPSQLLEGLEDLGVDWDTLWRKRIQYQLLENLHMEDQLSGGM